MKIIALIIGCLLFCIIPSYAQQPDNRSPLEIAKAIGDKLVRETSFKYKLTLPTHGNIFNEAQSVNFERTFASHGPAVAYAYTELQSVDEMDLVMQVAHKDACKIWLNGKEVYNKKGNGKLKLHFEERSIDMHDSCKLSLKKGFNKLLIKSETKGTNSWQVFIQPPPDKGAIVKKEFAYPNIGLSSAKNVDASVAGVTNWLLIGPFQKEGLGNQQLEMDLNILPQQSIEFGKMYRGQQGLVSWTIPKVEVYGDVIDAKEWGTPYNWNYHNGGVAWAMEELSELSDEKKYAVYASNFCNFHLNGKPFVEYQVNELYAFNSANSLFINTPLLDFTLAPSLPFIYKLRKDHTDFVNKDKYVHFIDSMMQYALYQQLRLPVTNIFTRTTPKKYTTWVDDMFMGIPFLVQASLYARDPALRKRFIDDAANQVIGFNKEVFDESANLYSHANYSGSSVKLPHWSRANGWGIWATSEVLMNLPKKDIRYPVILKHFQKHVKALIGLQDESGFWLNVLDRKDSRKEVSGTAIFCMAIARGIRLGWLDTKNNYPVVEKGWRALKTSISSDGSVHEICMGTMCSEDVNYYMNRPFYDNDTHGLFAVLFASMEMEKLTKLQKDILR